MHGPAPAPPPPRLLKPGTVVLLRVVFVAIAVLSLGLLAWVTLLRAALVHRRPVGWWIFGVDAALAIPLLAVVGSVPESDWRGDVALALILLQMAGAVAYYLVVDIRARAHARSFAGYGAPGRTPGAYAGPEGYGGYGGPVGYGGPGSPGSPRSPGGAGGPGAYGSGSMYEQGTMSGGRPGPYPFISGAGAMANPYATQLQPQPPMAQPQPQPPAVQPQPRPQRIERVRAELDELSEYLRRGANDGESAGGNGHHQEEGR
ncbi:hypothetical protein ABT381_23670 [Streptomyces sp. NPDC000151]|uniref:hypothetical protein n=1 Tax=Streptomyces sp. NPDC000151 TaxID=3154244 RepID=UPI00332E1578